MICVECRRRLARPLVDSWQDVLERTERTAQRMYELMTERARVLGLIGPYTGTWATESEALRDDWRTAARIADTLIVEAMLGTGRIPPAAGAR